MRATAQDGNRRRTNPPKHQLASVSLHRRLGKVRDIRVRERNRRLDALGNSIESRTQDDRYPWRLAVACGDAIRRLTRLVVAWSAALRRRHCSYSFPAIPPLPVHAGNGCGWHFECGDGSRLGLERVECIEHRVDALRM